MVAMGGVGGNRPNGSRRRVRSSRRARTERDWRLSHARLVCRRSRAAESDLSHRKWFQRDARRQNGSRRRERHARSGRARAHPAGAAGTKAAIEAGSVRLMPVRVTLDVMLARRKMRARDVAEKIGLSETQLSLLRTGKVRGMRFDTLSKLCLVLDCTPGEILDYDRDDADLNSKDD